jgi:hypothetical protein
VQRRITNRQHGLVGFDIQEDDRQFQVVNNRIPALKKIKKHQRQEAD